MGLSHSFLLLRLTDRYVFSSTGCDFFTETNRISLYRPIFLSSSLPLLEKTVITSYLSMDSTNCCSLFKMNNPRVFEIYENTSQTLMF